ncbi:DUF3370 family protein [Myxococcota bacterium]|nr:DUF3370 family protein [Myxococcota bacterium]
MSVVRSGHRGWFAFVALLGCGGNGPGGTSDVSDAAVSGRDARPGRWDQAGDARPRPLESLDARGGGGAAGTDASPADAAARSTDGMAAPGDAATAPGGDARSEPPTPDAAPGPEADAAPPSDLGPDAARPSPPDVDLDEDRWPPGDFAAERPAIPACEPLPGAGAGSPLIVSNNPEAFDGPGLLMGTARPTETRGGAEHRLRRHFGLYLHHLYRGADPLYLQVVVTNPNAAPVLLDMRGSAYTQSETGGVGLGQSPDFAVTRDAVDDTPRVMQRGVQVPSQRPVRVWSGRLERNREVDGRFWFDASDEVYVYVVATRTDDLNDAVNAVFSDAPGDYRISGDPPPPFGREAGVYAHDTWRGDFSVGVPAAGRRLAFIVNTATGGGHPQVQASPALMHLDGSARESVGMYGMTYDLVLRLRNRGETPRRVRVAFASLVRADLSRYWDGMAMLDGAPIVVRHTPEAPTTPLVEWALAPGEVRPLHFTVMVPGLTSIPQALLLESVE